jgi:hypothetical protein
LPRSEERVFVHTLERFGGAGFCRSDAVALYT